MSNLSEQAYAHVQQLILSGKLTSGSVITEAVIADELGMSRTPVGEAVRQLVSQGLVEQIPRKGAIVCSFGRRELIDLFEMRQAIESFAAEKVAASITGQQIDKLSALSTAMKRITEQTRADGDRPLSGLPLQHLLTADMTFHMLVLQDTGNPRLQQAIAGTRLVFSVFRMQRPILDLSVVESAHMDHDAIISAFQDRDGKRARQLMERHVVSSRDQALRELDLEASSGKVDDSLANSLPDHLRKQLEEIDDRAPSTPVL